MSIKVSQLPLSGVFELTPAKKIDNRGYFSRLFCQEELISINRAKNILQMNLSFSKYAGTVRGMHFQLPPYQEDKIVRCIKGSIFDVVVDIRSNSKTHGQWTSLELSASKANSIYIPKGFAHGFQTLENECEVLYCHTEIHVPEAESGFNSQCEKIGIKWPKTPKNLSCRDKNLSSFNGNIQ